MLKFVYAFFLGLLLVIFVGMGIATFYPAPKAPEYPKELQVSTPDKEYTAAQKVSQQAYQQQMDDYAKRSAAYNRNVSLLALGAAVLLLVVSLAIHTRLDVLADGLLLGGTFTLVYSIGRSFAGDSPKHSFLVVSIGLCITMVVGYLKFVKPAPAVPTKKK